ncbi:hypothetical protein [Sphaerisporangium album]|uniref:hypothetical protein n=1 Tax=Sphaerisporangium album TaxID=509200 RepID=UPI0015F018ED|nr:hypothetical protein [Sphaerisporangium album]
MPTNLVLDIYTLLNALAVSDGSDAYSLQTSAKEINEALQKSINGQVSLPEGDV